MKKKTIPAEVNARAFMKRGFEMFCQLPVVESVVIEEEMTETPRRATDALFELTKGCWENPDTILDVMFDAAGCDEIVYMNDISFVSVCQHHLLPFFGKVHFGYVPKEYIVGLSKIPRLVECLACRPQIQEKLATDIVGNFMHCISPWGCGVVIEAWHLCVCARGVKQTPAYAKTSALRGSFKKDPTRHEFLDGVRKTTELLWP